MKVAQLAKLLDSLVHGLDGVVGAPATRDFKTFAEAMQPFGNASVGEFTAFLNQFGAEFQQTGKITAQGKIAINKPARAPKPDGPQQVAAAVSAIKALFDEIDRGTVDDARVDQVLKPYEKLTVAHLHEVLAALDIAERPRQKAKIFDKIRQVVHHQLESRSKAGSVGGGHAPLGPAESIF
jgi:hypothetical protein